MLTQPQAQEYCSELNGTLHDFQSNIANHEDDDDDSYWAGLVYIEEIKKYELGDGYLRKGRVGGNQNGGKLCVMAKMEEDNKSPTLRSSECCDERAYVICKVPEDGGVAGSYCYFFCTSYFSVLLPSDTVANKKSLVPFGIRLRICGFLASRVIQYTLVCHRRLISADPHASGGETVCDLSH